MSVLDPYQVLGVDPSAGNDVIDAAYKRLAKQHHPDVAPGPEAQARMVEINLARDILRDPVRRAAVDRARQRTQATSARVVADEARSHARPAGAQQPGASSYRPSTPVRAAPGQASPPGATGHQGSRPQGDGPQAWPFPGMDEQGGMFGSRGSAGWSSGTEGGTPGSAAGGGRTGTYGEAGPPPGNPSGSILGFGRYLGWSLGEIARFDLGYLEWLERMPIGRPYTLEIDKLLRQHGQRADRREGDSAGFGLYRRR